MSETVHLVSTSKLNLSLLVFRSRPDGYHPLWSIFQEIDLSDTMHVTLTNERKWTLTCSNPDVPTDDRNILSRLYHRFVDDIDTGLLVHIDKGIPLGAGLGGASANAARFLVWMNSHFHWAYSESQLMEIGAEFGADVPFFIRGGTALVQGIGDQITPISPGLNRVFLLINPGLHLSTPEVFSYYDSDAQYHRCDNDIDECILTSHLGPNDLKQSVFDRYPIYSEIQAIIAHYNGPELYMTGSGATVFLALESIDDAQLWANRLQLVFPSFWFRVSRALFPL